MDTLRVKKVGRVAKIVSLILAVGNFTLDASSIESDAIEETMIATCDHDYDRYDHGIILMKRFTAMKRTTYPKRLQQFLFSVMILYRSTRNQIQQPLCAAERAMLLR
jgi:hypothetical protein